MDKKIVKNSIEIQASKSVIWEVLTSPDHTKRYMFGCEAVSDWTPGSALVWKMIYEGKEMIPVKGSILEIQPPLLLVYTVIDPNATYPDVPENYLRVTYDLTEEKGVVTLTVTQDGFENAADGEKRYQDVYNNGEGWNPILIQIKELAESIER
jgi:uncharacterized protein YndB with AHSA1/START domain